MAKSYLREYTNKFRPFADFFRPQCRRLGSKVSKYTILISSNSIFACYLHTSDWIAIKTAIAILFVIKNQSKFGIYLANN